MKETSDYQWDRGIEEGQDKGRELIDTNFCV